MKKLALGILSLALFLAACEDPAANKTKATTTNSTTNATNYGTSNSCGEHDHAGDGNERHGLQNQQRKFQSRIHRLESYRQTRRRI